jgi:hypothetical protein
LRGDGGERLLSLELLQDMNGRCLLSLVQQLLGQVESPLLFLGGALAVRDPRWKKEAQEEDDREKERKRAGPAGTFFHSETFSPH